MTTQKMMEEGAAIESFHDEEAVHKSEVPDTEEDVSNEYVLNVAFWTFLGFLLLEAVFAIVANSAAMLEDAEAMSVDALTYLFNLCAERIKNRPYTKKELALPQDVREYRRELLRLYLELVPPFLSVSTLIVVTSFAIKDAVVTISQPDDVPEEDVDVSIMMGFSAANLLLDIVNVACFARAHQAFGLTTVRQEVSPTRYSVRSGEVVVLDSERKSLLQGDIEYYTDLEEFEPTKGMGELLLVNLNMCSAWTHICADTLRSTAVLIAALISFLWPEVVSGEMADSMATIVVSIIILISLIPLLHGLVETAKKIWLLSTHPQRPAI